MFVAKFYSHLEKTTKKIYMQSASMLFVFCSLNVLGAQKICFIETILLSIMGERFQDYF